MNYKNFIKLLKQDNINNLNELPIKSIYRKLKRIMDVDFDTVYAKHTPEKLSIFGEYKNKGGCCGKVYDVSKKTWGIEVCLLSCVKAMTESFTVSFTVGKWE